MMQKGTVIITVYAYSRSNSFLFRYIDAWEVLNGYETLQMN